MKMLIGVLALIYGAAMFVLWILTDYNVLTLPGDSPFRQLPGFNPPSPEIAAIVAGVGAAIVFISWIQRNK